MDLSKSERVHVTSVTPGFLEVLSYLNSLMTVYYFIKQDQTTVNASFSRDRQPRSSSIFETLSYGE